jgi:hypothetical protein
MPFACTIGKLVHMSHTPLTPHIFWKPFNDW